MTGKLLMLLSALACATGAAAAERNKNVGNSAKDPNAKVCEDIMPVGTRLAVKRICATRAQWEQKRRNEKEWLDKVQREQCAPGSEGCP